MLQGHAMKFRTLLSLVVILLALLGWSLIQPRMRLLYCTEMGYDAYEMTPEGRVRCLIEQGPER